MKTKFTVFSVFLLFFIAIIIGGGCINIDNPVVQPVDYRSIVKFVNLKPGDTIKVNVDGSDMISSIPFGEIHKDSLNLPAGSRVFVFKAGDTIRKSLEAEKKYTVFYVGKGSDSVLFAVVRNTFDEPYPSGKALIRFLHLSPNLGTSKVIVSWGGKDSTFSNVVFKGGTPYLAIASFPVKYTVISGSDTLLKAQDSGVSKAGRYSVVVYDLKENLKIKFFQED